MLIREITTRDQKIATAATPPAATEVKRVLVITKQDIPKLLRKLAPDIVKKGLLKGIPLAGWIFAIYFATEDLKKGNYTLAGVDMASGLGGWITAIPMIAAQCAIGMYGSAYKDPKTGQDADFTTDVINDREATWDRVQMLAGWIKESVVDGVKERLSNFTAPDPALAPIM